jgi:hypothetical protein
MPNPGTFRSRRTDGVMSALRAESPRANPVADRAPLEARVLLACAKAQLTEGERDRLSALLAAPVDWETLHALAARHGLAQLLFFHLDALPPTSPATLPAAQFTRLWAFYEAARHRNAAMTLELLRVIDLLEANGIPALPYKGPALADALYGDVALRDFGDLDIVLRRDDIRAARALLERHGYRPEYPLSPAMDDALLDSPAQYHYALVHEKSHLLLELHWKTDALYPVEAALAHAWWADASRAELHGREIRRLPAEALLLVLLIHGTKHRWHRLAWLADVAEMIRRHPSLDWTWIERTARRFGCERRMAIGLHLARTLLDAPLPARIAARLDAMRLDAIATRIVAPLFAPSPPEPGALSSLHTDLRLYERHAHKLRHLANVTLAPSLVEWTRWPLPRALHCLYLPLRLGRLVRKYALMLAARA